MPKMSERYAIVPAGVVGGDPVDVVYKATAVGQDDSFVAIDFETADCLPDSACSVALVHVVGDRIIDRMHRLIRPPRPRFEFTYIHGITWQNVRDAPTFATVWSELAPFASRGRFLAAHNASFDRRVLHACCRMSGIDIPGIPFLCTVTLSRRTWDLPSHRLDVVCRHLGIDLNHHQALSDAQACARIVLHARQANPAVMLQVLARARLSHAKVQPQARRER